jgi:hypothetical protein
MVCGDIMPSNFKKLVRARMEKTGESWQTAARHVRAQGAPEPDSGGQRENGGRMDEDGGGGFKRGDQGASAAWKVLLAGVAARGGGPSTATTCAILANW